MVQFLICDLPERYRPLGFFFSAGDLLPLKRRLLENVGPGADQLSAFSCLGQDAIVGELGPPVHRSD